MLSISVFPDSMVSKAKRLLEYLCLYASYRLFDSSVRRKTGNLFCSTSFWYVSSGCHMHALYKTLVVGWNWFNVFNRLIKIKLGNCFVFATFF